MLKFIDSLKRLQEEVERSKKEKENKEAKALARQKAKATPKAFHDDSDDEPYAKSGCMSDSGCKTSASKYCLMKLRLSSGLPFEMFHFKLCESLFIVLNINLYWTQINQLPPPFREVRTER